MGDNNKPETSAGAEKPDDELAALLDSALEDFKREQEKAEKADTESEAADEKKPEEKVELAEEWNEEFINQAAAHFESSLASLLGSSSDGSQASPEQIQQKLQQMAEAAQQAIENPTVSEDSIDFASTISQTIQGLNAGAEGLQTPFSEQDLMNLFGGQGDGNAFMPFMQGMMQSLLSKDVLYPSLKDILDKYPDWLRTNQENLSNEDVERYKNQIKLMEEVCGELEQERETDGVDLKKARFDKVLSLMQKLQDYGQPPTDLVGDVGPPLPLDMQNSADPNQCNLM